MIPVAIERIYPNACIEQAGGRWALFNGLFHLDNARSQLLSDVRGTQAQDLARGPKTFLPNERRSMIWQSRLEVNRVPSRNPIGDGNRTLS